MAEFRFEPDPDFEIVVTAVAMGQDQSGRPVGGAQSRVRSARRRRTTLVDVGDQIIEEAKRLANRELPSRNSSGGRSIDYPFDAPDRTGKTYTQSFRHRVVLQQGRLILLIENTHEHAADVEFGNHPSGQVKSISRKRGVGGKQRFFAIPLTRAGIARNRRLTASPEARERARQRSRLAYAKRRSSDLPDIKRSFAKRNADIQRRLDNNKAKSGIKTKAYAKAEADMRDFQKDRQAAITRFNSARTLDEKARAALKQRRSSAFVKLNPKTGKVSLYTQTFRTYRGYAILRHATRSVTVRTLE